MTMVGIMTATLHATVAFDGLPLAGAPQECRA